VDYIPQKVTMTGPYYGEVLTNLRHAVKEKRREILTRGPLLLNFLTNVKSVLVYREITLKNNVIVLSVPLVHYTELQNFLIASRICFNID